MSGVRVIVAVAAVLVVAGCTGGDGGPPEVLPSVTPSVAAEPSVTPSGESEPSATPTPAAEPTPQPREGMHEYSQAGVGAFTRYVIDVINYSYRTNDVDLLTSISTDDCQFCANAVDQLVFIKGEGGRIQGGQIEVTNERFDITGPAEGFETSAAVQLTVTASETIDGDGNVRNSEEDRDRYIIFDLAREADEWALEEVRRASGT